MLALASIIFRMILENRSPVRTLAWIVVLLTIPVAGMVFYFWFGVNYRKSRCSRARGWGI